MSGLVVALLPLAIGSAVVPVHLLVTALLLQGAGRIVAAAWIAGMTSTRLLQGVVFGLILAPADRSSTGPAGSAVVLSVVLLVVAIVLLAMAARALVDEPDEDAPPPGWMTSLEGIGPGRAYLVGFGIVAIGPKFWVFTLGAIAAIAEVGPGTGPAIAAFLAFVLLATSLQLALLGAAVAAPARANAALTRLVAALTTYGRPIKIGLGLAFGLWFLVKALTGLGVI